MDSAWFRDMAERAVATFVQAFLAVWIVSWTDTGEINVSFLEQAFAAGVVAGLSVVKSALARYVGDPDTAAMLPEGE